MVIITIFIPKINLIQFLKVYDLHFLRDQLSVILSKSFICLDVILKVSELNVNDSVITLISNFISDQLKKRVPFRRVMRNAILKVKKIPLKGIKVQISGRLNGAEIARTEWVREGRIPLHTIDANISYTSSTVLMVFYNKLL
jgi:ribosomal protein S3